MIGEVVDRLGLLQRLAEELAAEGGALTVEVMLDVSSRALRSLLEADGLGIYFSDPAGSRNWFAHDGSLPIASSQVATEPSVGPDADPVIHYPLPLGHDKSGTMMLHYRRSHPQPHEAHLLASAAALWLAGALERARAVHQAAVKDAELATLAEVGRLIDLAPNPRAALPAVLETVWTTTRRWHAFLLRWNGGNSPSDVIAGPGGPSEEAISTALSNSDDALAALVATDEPAALPESSQLSRLLRRHGVDRCRSLPLQSRGHHLGILLAGAPPESAEGQSGFDLALAERVAASLDGARLFGLVERAKQEWEATFDAISDGVSIQDLEYTIIRANWAFARMVGSTPQQIVGRKCYQVVRGVAEPCAFCPALAAASGEPTSAHVSREPNLGDRWISTSIYPLKDSTGQTIGLVHVLRDLSEERRLQETVVRTERLRALGEMATGVAHDFGNLLSSIGGWAEVLLSEAHDESVRRPAAAILQAAEDGAEAVRRIQDYVRARRGTNYTLVDMNAVVNDALELARPRWRTLAARNRIAFDVSTDLQPVPPVTGNPAELREVLLNLIFNAIDAMPGGGKLVVATRADGEAVMAEVSDTGVGMSSEIQSRIFDPFFTTKESGGSGLGLTIAFAVVERHRGYIAVASEPGRGAAFKVVLPVATRVAAPANIAPAPSRPSPSGF